MHEKLPNELVVIADKSFCNDGYREIFMVTALRTKSFRDTYLNAFECRQLVNPKDIEN